MPDHGWMDGQQRPGPEVRRWVLAPRFSRRRVVARIAAAVGAWAPVQAVLTWLTAASVTTPFGVTLGIDGLPEGWPAVPAATGLGGATVISAVAGLAVVGWAAQGHRTDVVVADARGVRVERQGSGGTRTVAVLDWDVHGDRLAAGSLTPNFVATRVSPAGTPEQHRQIAEHLVARFADHLAARLAARRADAAPAMSGWTAWYDDRGPTLEENRRDRRDRAWLSGAGAVVTGAHTAAFHAATSSDPRWWFLVAGCGWATAALTFRCGDNLRRPPRWIARPGKVVLEIRGPGRGFAFEARSLEHTALDYEEGGTGSRLVAVRGEDGTGGRRDILVRHNDDAPSAVGAWLARHAEIPLHRRHEFVPKPS
jgi:hypothetical protein